MSADIVDLIKAGNAGVMAEGGFAPEVCVRTELGLRAVSDLQAGESVQSATGDDVKIAEVRRHAPSTLWTLLPAAPGASPVVVSGNQLLFCQHFLCKALFGKLTVLFRADHVKGLGVQASDGSMRILHELVLERPAVLRVGGYELLCSSPTVSHSLCATDGERAGEVYTDSVPGSTSGIVQAFVSAAHPLLTPHETRQLCDAGVLFRHVEGR